MGNQQTTEGMSIFDFTVPAATDGSKINLNDFRGKKAYLLVNVASQ